MNKPTNSKKLEKPFEIYKIYLSDEDKEILGHRNKFLHGMSPLIENEENIKDSEMTYISLKMLLLVSTLVLKYIGYNGHIKNFASWHRFNRKEELTEHLFKVI